MAFADDHKLDPKERATLVEGLHSRLDSKDAAFLTLLISIDARLEEANLMQWHRANAEHERKGWYNG